MKTLLLARELLLLVVVERLMKGMPVGLWDLWESIDGTENQNLA